LTTIHPPALHFDDPVGRCRHQFGVVNGINVITPQALRHRQRLSCQPLVQEGGPTGILPGRFGHDPGLNEIRTASPEEASEEFQMGYLVTKVKL
jgi:hypothetical protein